MYAVVALEPGDHWLSFKCTPDDFARLVEQVGIIPAPYLARAHWVSRAETKRLIGQARDIVIAKLPKKNQAALVE